jgi:hypothetical protein
MSKLGISAPDGKTRIIRDVHNTGDIIQLVLEHDGQYVSQVDKFTAKLRGEPVYDQCKYIWQTLRNNVKYIPDGPESQNLKSPARLFSDGVGDCKSFSLFETNCLRSLGIPYCYRFVSFRSDPTPTHVYVVANPGKKNEIIMDGVLPNFDYQKPFTFKYDVPMLSMLTGVPGMGANIFQKAAAGIKKDTTALVKSMKTNAANAQAYAKDPKKLATDTGKAVNAAIKDAESVVKTVNPAAVLVRSGILLSMENNIMNAAGKIKLGYLTPAQASAKGYDMTEWGKLNASLNKFISSFVNTWGGNANDLKAAILKGGGALNGIGCATTMTGIGAAKSTDIQKFLAAALPIILALINDIIGTNFGAMTSGASQGFDEQQANKAPTLTPQQMQDITAGAEQLAAAAQNSGLLPGGSPAPGPRPKSAPRPPAKKTNMLVPIGVGVAAILLLTHKN